MRVLGALLLLLAMLAGAAVANPGLPEAQAKSSKSGSDILAQRKADLLARQNRLYHPHIAPWPKGAKAEGVGRGGSRKRAISNCCYWGKRKPMSIAAAKSATSGRWYACVIYW